MTETKEPFVMYILEGVFLVFLIFVVGSIAYYLIAEPTPSELREPKIIANFIEAQELEVARKVDSMNVTVQKTDTFENGVWSHDDQLFISNVSVTDSVTFSLPIPEESNYQIVLYLTKSYDYGEWVIKVNDLETRRVDLFSTIVEPTEPVYLGMHHLTPSKTILLFEVVGHNTKARPPYYQLGIDGVEIKPVNEAP